jgi:hypothetical protein
MSVQKNNEVQRPKPESPTRYQLKSFSYKPPFKFGIQRCRFLDNSITAKYGSNVKELRKFI